MILLLLPILLAMSYGGGYISQLAGNYSRWQQGGGYPGDGTAPVSPSASPAECLKAIFDFPYNLYGIFLCTLLFGLLFVLVMKLGFGDKGEYDRERNLTYSRKGTYGTAGFMSGCERDKVLELDIRKSRGTILGQLDGKVICVPEHSMMNKNIAVYGAPGSMKSRAFARNMIFQCVARGESLVITELTAVT